MNKTQAGVQTDAQFLKVKTAEAGMPEPGVAGASGLPPLGVPSTIAPSPQENPARAAKSAVKKKETDEEGKESAAEGEVAAGAAGAGEGSSENMLLAQANAGSETTEKAAGTAEAAGGEGAAAGAGAMGGASVGMVAAGLGVALAAAAGGGGGAAAAGGAAGGVSLFAIAGRVVDGYVRGAQIYIDKNGNGIPEDNLGENTGILTDATGNFSGQVSQLGPIIAVGGTNIDTGLPNTVLLKAPQGSTVINPLTTVLQEYKETSPGASDTDAQAAVKTALGLPSGINLTTYDPYAVVDPTDATALAAQKVAAQIVNTLALSGGNDQAALDNIVALIIGSTAPGSVDLTSSTVLTQVYEGTTGANLADVTKANTAVELASTLATSGPGSLTLLTEAALDGGASAPVFLSATTAQVGKFAAIGTVVYQVSAVDLESDPITYSLLDNAGGKFSINSTTGLVTVAGSINLDAGYQIVVQATDGINAAVFQSVGISVVTSPNLVVGDLTLQVTEPSAEVVQAVQSSGVGVVSLDSSHIYVHAGAPNAYAELNLANARGTIASLGVAATEASADARADIYAVHGTASIADGVVVTVEASGMDSNAELYLDNITGNALVLDVTASGASSDATLELYDATVGIAALNVTASGYEAYASADIETSGSVGNINVHATGVSVDGAAAGAHISAYYPDDAVDLNASVIDVRAGVSAEANLNLYDAAGSIASITASAAASADVEVDIEIDGSIGDITVEADYRATARVCITSSDTDGSVSMNASVISVSATSYDADAELSLEYAAGSISSLTVTASSDDAYASASIGMTGSIGNITVHANGISLNNSAPQAYAEIYSSGDASVTLNASVIEVSAGTSAEAQLYVSGAIGSIASLTVSADAYGSADTEIAIDGSVGSISVVADGVSADAELSLANATGNIASLTVSATSADAIANANIGLTGNIGSLVLSAGVSSEAAAHIAQTVFGGNVTVSGDGHIILEYSDETAATVTIASRDAAAEFDLKLLRADEDYTGGTADAAFLTANMLVISGLSADTNGGSDLIGLRNGVLHYTEGCGDAGDEATFLASAYAALDSAEAGNNVYFQQVGSDGYLAYDYDGSGISGLVKLTGVTNLDAADFFNGTQSVYALNQNSQDCSTDIVQTNGLIGNITVVDQGGSCSEASADVSGFSAGNVILDNSVVEVTASGGASSRGANAHLRVSDAVGSIASLSVSASSRDSNASAHINNSSGDTGGLSVGNITVFSSGHSSDASARLSSSSDATVNLNDSAIFVFASGYSADAQLSLSNGTGSIASLVVSTDAENAIAHALIQTDGSVGDVSVLAFGGSSDASASISAASEGGSVFLDASEIEVVNGNGGSSSNAYLSLSDATGSIASLDVISNYPGSAIAEISGTGGAGTLDMTGSVITVAAENGHSRDSSSLALLQLSNVQGTIDTLNVTAGQFNDGCSNDVAVAHVQIAGHIDQLNLHAYSADSFVEAVIDQTEFGGSVTVDTNFNNSSDAGHVVLEYTNATARSIDIVSNKLSNQSEFDLVLKRADLDFTAGTADIAFLSANTLEVSGFRSASNAVGNDLIGLGNGALHYTESTADVSFDAFIANAYTALNTTVEGNNVYFGVVGTDGYLAYDYDGSGITGLVKLTGVTDFASTDFLGSPYTEFDTRQTVEVINTNTSIIAARLIGDITVLSDSNGSANAVIHPASNGGHFTLQDSVINVTATSCDARLNMSGATGSIESLSVTAAVDSGQARAIINTSGDVGVSIGDITVSAGASSDAYARFSGDAPVYLDNSVVSVIADGDRANADLVLEHATGNMASLTVTATSSSCDASANIHMNGSIEMLSVSASGNSSRSTDADVQINNSSRDADSVISIGNITIHADEGGNARLQAGHCSNDAGVSLESSVIEVSTAGSIDNGQTYAYLNIDGATGSIASLTVSTAASGSSCDSAIADINIDGSVGNIDVHASGVASDAQANVRSTSVASLSLSAATSADAQAYIDQSVFGGTVTVTGNGYVSLEYADQTAQTIDLTGRSIDAEFDLTVSSTDADHAATDTALTDHLLTITGFNAPSGGGQDLLQLGQAVAYSENTADAGSESAFLAAAFSALNNGQSIGQAYFGVVGSDGYLAYDYDGSGISSVIKLAGVTDLAAEDLRADLDYSADATAIVSGSIATDVLSVYTDSDSSDLDVNVNLSFANADIYLVDVEAGVEFSQAVLHLTTAAGNIDAMLVETTDNNSVAQAFINTDGTLGDVRVVACNGSSDASATISSASLGGSVQMLDSVISVDSDGGTAGVAALELTNATGSISYLSVSADGDYSTASAVIEGDGTLQVDDVELQANGWYSNVSLALSGVTMMDSSIDVNSYEVSADVELDLTNASGSIASLRVYSEYEYGSSSANVQLDGTIGSVSLNAGGSSSDASATLQATSVGSIDVSVGDDATANLALDVAEGSGPISVSGSASGTAKITYLGDQHADTIDLSAFSGATNLALNGADADTTDWAALEANMLQLDGLDAVASSLTLDFANWNPADGYTEDLADAGDLTTFGTAADVALATSGAYFGVVGANGYLAYDFDHTGVTGLIELVGVTDFDPSQIQSLIPIV